MNLPIQYNQTGSEADYVFIIGGRGSNSAELALATCKHCAILKSNNRPIFGGLQYYFGPLISKFSNGLDNIEFQTLTYVAVFILII